MVLRGGSIAGRAVGEQGSLGSGWVIPQPSRVENQTIALPVLGNPAGINRSARLVS